MKGLEIFPESTIYFLLRDPTNPGILWLQRTEATLRPFVQNGLSLKQDNTTAGFRLPKDFAQV